MPKQNVNVLQTLKEVNQRTKFGLVTQFLQPINSLVRIGCKGSAGDVMTPYNYACRHALANAIVGDAPDCELDFAKVQISFGDLSRVSAAAATLLGDLVNFVWDDNSSTSTGNVTDHAVMLVYNVDAGEFSFAVDTVMRGTKAGSLPLPYAEVGDRLLFYLFFQSAADPLIVSESQYLGSHTVVE